MWAGQRMTIFRLHCTGGLSRLALILVCLISLVVACYCSATFPSLEILLHIFATLPVTTATDEVVFSAVKLRKSELSSKLRKQAVGGRPPRYAPAPLLPLWAPKRLAPPSTPQRSSSFPRPICSHADRCSCLTC